MKLIIAGSREINDEHLVQECIDQTGILEKATEIVHGACRGVDLTAQKLFDGKLPIKTFPADWKKYGKGAGYIRNYEMAQYADALIAIATPDSRGTKNMAEQMKKLGKPVWFFLVEPKEEKSWKITKKA